MDSADSFRTEHVVVTGSSFRMDEISDNSVDLVVTSPPYPMIEMWDSLFISMDDRIGHLLESSDGFGAFEAMHSLLDNVWAELYRVMKSGGIVCINIGDATRKVGNNFALYPNHMRIQKKMIELGFNPLPGIIWRKPNNSPTKFMGSGMLPPNAYVTLEHEHILIFRKKGLKKITDDKSKLARYRSAFFWEERNGWFSDLWEIQGTDQNLSFTRRYGDLTKIIGSSVIGAEKSIDNPGIGDKGRDMAEKKSRKKNTNGVDGMDKVIRTAAFPLRIAYVLINMFSIYGDVILDPFLGTGTTSVAALASARNSIGYEIKPEYRELIENRLYTADRIAKDILRMRLEDHGSFTENASRSGKTLNYLNKFYGFPVMTAQEREILFFKPESIECIEKSEKKAVFSANHIPYYPD